jgi:hypothetical protein
MEDAELAALNAEVVARETRLSQGHAKARGLEAAVQAAQGEIGELRAQLATKGAALAVPDAAPPATPMATDLSADTLGMGRSYALIIGNAHYRDAAFRALPSVEKDAHAVGSALARYGFRDHTTHIDNGTRDDIMNALAAFGAQLGPTDNALIYYSGHGAIAETGGATYWMPSDADPANPASWVSTGWVTEMIAQMRARHILVVVDSCYAGALVHASNLRLTVRSAAAEPNRVRFLAQLRSRTVLTSGGDEPVAATGPGGNSLFARLFTQILEHNTQVLDASALYDTLSQAMSEAGVVTEAGTLQLPRYSVLANTSHLNGDFLFVPDNRS